MKFVEGTEEVKQENNQESNAPLFKDNSSVDLMKAQTGFEEVKNDIVIQELVEPKAPVITDPNQLNTIPSEQINSTPTLGGQTSDEEKLNLAVEKNIENIQEPVIVPPVNVPSGKPQEEFMPKKKSKLGLVVLNILLFIVGLACGYYFFFLTPERVVKNGLNSLYGSVNTLDDKLSENINFSTMKSSGNIKFDTTIESYASLKGYNINYNIGYDVTNEKINTKLSLLNGSGDELLSLLYFVKDNVSYIDSEDITPKVIKVDLSEYTNELFTINDSKENLDYSYLAKVVGDAFYDTMSKEKLSRKITYDEAYYNSISLKLTYSIDSEEYKRVYTAIVNAIKADSKALEILAVENGGNKEETIEMLNNSLEQTDYNIPDTNIVIYINLFNSEIVGASITSENSEVKYTYDGKEYKLSATSSGEYNETMDVIYNEVKNTVKINYSTRVGEKTSTLEANINIKEVGSKKNETTIDITYTPDASVSNQYMSFTMSDATEEDVTIEDADVTGAVAMEELTIDELNAMMEAVYGLLASIGFNPTGV